jgi:hypothetical protein
MSDFYRQILVFEQINPTKAFRYVCYEDLGTGKFAVSSGEILTIPQDEETLAYHARQQVEHFITEGVSGQFDTLIEAVSDFQGVMKYEQN